MPFSLQCLYIKFCCSNFFSFVSYSFTNKQGGKNRVLLVVNFFLWLLRMWWALQRLAYACLIHPTSHSPPYITLTSLRHTHHTRHTIRCMSHSKTLRWLARVISPGVTSFLYSTWLVTMCDIRAKNITKSNLNFSFFLRYRFFLNFAHFLMLVQHVECQMFKKFCRSKISWRFM